MKRKLVIVNLILFFSVVTLIAAKIGLVWDDPDNPVGTIRQYKAYYAPVGSTIFSTLGVTTDGEVRTLVGNLPAGFYQFYVTAISTNGIESDPSNIIQVRIPFPVKLNEF